MLKTIACMLCLLAGAAYADGVPLITAGPPLAANDAARLLQATKLPNFVKLHPIALNKAAFGANVVTVLIDGKEYRFGGALMPKNPPAPKAVTEKQPDMQAWSGREPGGGMLTLSKDLETGRLYGSMFLPPARSFTVHTPPHGAVVMVESDANVTATLSYAGSASRPASGGTR